MIESQLIDVVKADNIEAVKRLIEGGADVNQQDEQGWTPLNWAAGRGNPDIVSLLVSSGADVFKVGRDLRTPYMIALAAGREAVARYLREVEDEMEGEKPARPERKYCKAYHLKDLRRFGSWAESSINRSEKLNNESVDREVDSATLSDEQIVFLHQDYTVTQSMWHNEDVIFEQVTPEWKRFCEEDLQFKAPDDLDLIVPSKSSVAEAD